MNQLKISTRLAILIGVLASFLVGIGAIGVWGMRQSNTALKSVYEDRTVPAAQLGEIHAFQLESQNAANYALSEDDAAIVKHKTDLIESNGKQIAQIWDAYMATYLTPDEAQVAKTFAEQRTRYMQEGLDPMVAALRAGDKALAKRIEVEKMVPLYQPLSASLDTLDKIQVDEAKRLYESQAASFQQVQALAVGSMALGLTFAVLFGWVMVRSITRQLGAEPGEAAAVAQAVAMGDLSSEIHLHVNDSTSLMANLQRMQTSLSVVVNDVRTSAQNVAGASMEIAQGNADLANRTEEQASALEETAASMEELNSTVRQTADNAAQGNSLAKTASATAVKGGEVVNRVVETMKGINGSSRRIAEIIQVIDGIAFQTNILALNAAVEAARAGEQGRGFAVVATEVRNLAQRSAAAAKEIKTLITDSVEQVERGTDLVNVAGETMQEIVSSIQRVTDIMAEISVASSEQSTGVLQVSEAVSQMDQVTQQNAALVEESAAASESLKSQSQTLVESVQLFKLAQDTQDAITTPAAKAAPAKAASAANGNSTWNGQDRRGPNRAQNVTRPAFGSPKASTTSLKTAAKPLPMAQGLATRSTQRTGTDDWESF